MDQRTDTERRLDAAPGQDIKPAIGEARKRSRGSIRMRRGGAQDSGHHGADHRRLSSANSGLLAQYQRLQIDRRRLHRCPHGLDQRAGRRRHRRCAGDGQSAGRGRRRVGAARRSRLPGGGRSGNGASRSGHGQRANIDAQVAAQQARIDQAENKRRSRRRHSPSRNNRTALHALSKTAPAPSSRPSNTPPVSAGAGQLCRGAG